MSVGLRTLIGRMLPGPAKTALRKTLDRAEFDAAARRGMIPPRQLWPLVGGPERFVEQGRGEFENLVRQGRLTPQSSVLDIGCGLGKQAIHFAEYLKPPGRYEGFDVMELGIRWCNAAIASRHPHMGFTHVSLRSEMYSPEGADEASEFAFPYPSESFDFAFLTSVFTHLFRADVSRYLSEIARVLKPGGLCFATFYLLGDEARHGIAAGTSVFTFAIPYQDSWVETLDPPEAAVAHEESVLLEMIASKRLVLEEPIRRGAWSTEAREDQDFVLLRKP